MTTPSQPPTWLRDEEVLCCPLCSAAFNFFKRRHHCRNCGKIFCDDCSPGRVGLPQYGLYSPVRVCLTCNREIAPAPAPTQYGGGYGGAPSARSSMPPGGLGNLGAMLQTANSLQAAMAQGKRSHANAPTTPYAQPQQQNTNVNIGPVIPVHEGPRPINVFEPDYALPPLSKIVVLPDRSVIQRGILSFIIKGNGGGAAQIQPIPIYVPTCKLLASNDPEANVYIRKVGPCMKMLYSTANSWVYGELVLDGPNITWRVQSEGAGEMKVKCGLNVKRTDRGAPRVRAATSARSRGMDQMLNQNFGQMASGIDGTVDGADFCLLLAARADTNEVINQVQGMNAMSFLAGGAQSLQQAAQAKVVYFSFASHEERMDWVNSILHNLNVYLRSEDYLNDVKRQFITFARQVGVLDPDNMDWRRILDEVYNDDLQNM